MVLNCRTGHDMEDLLGTDNDMVYYVTDLV